jgi:hypothetical protein
LLTLSLLGAVNVDIKKVSGVESPYIAVIPENIVDQNLTLGKNFTVSIYTNYGENTVTEWDVTGYQFNLFYDPTILKGGIDMNKTDTWTIDSPTRLLRTTQKPIYPDSEKVYVNHMLMSKPSNYTIDYELGIITIPRLVDKGDEVEVIYLYQIPTVTDGDIIVGGSSGSAAGYFDNEAGELSLTVGFYDTEGEVTSMFRPPPWNGTLAYVTFTVVGTGISNITMGKRTQLVGWNFTAEEEYSVIATLFTNTDSWTGDGATNIFSTTKKPIVEGTETIYVNETLVTQPDNYTIDYNTGEITFTRALGLGEEIEATYDYTNYDHIQHGYFNNIPSIHDVAVVNLVAPTTAVLEQLQQVNFNVTARNEGNFTETFNVTAYANTTEIGTQKITDLTSGGKETLTFSWNITEATKGNYTITANATILASTGNPTGIDEDLTDNTKTKQITLKAIHDIAAISLVTSQPALIGPPMIINATVANKGSYDENVTLTVSYKTVPTPDDTGVVGTKNFTLTKGATSNTISLSWNTTGLKVSTYEINATATIDTDEHLADNTETTRITLALGHDVAIKRIFAPTPVDIGELVTIRVQVENPGGYNETFDVEVTYDTSTIEEPYSATMLPGASEYISFSWNTTGVTPDSYTLTARAVLDGDINPANNLETKSIIVKLPLGTIVGNVTDASTGLPIAGATVTAGDYTNISDANGYYVMSGVTPGNYTVAVSAAGYESASQHNRVVVSGETVTVNFALRVNSVITLSVDPTTITVGESITVSGSIDPIRGNVTVTIWYRTGQGTWTILTTVTTDENSQYSHVWTVDTIGTYEVKASWLGDENTAPAESNVQTITVEEAPSGVPWELYVAAAGVTAVIIATIAFYFLKIRRPKPT